MSDTPINIYADFILRTAAAQGEIKSFVASTTGELQRLANTSVEIPVAFRPPDASAVLRRVQELQQQVVEIPVRYVPHGEPPRPTVPSGAVNQTASGSRFGTNSAGNSGGSLALQNGRPGVTPLGMVGNTASQGSSTAGPLSVHVVSEAIGIAPKLDAIAQAAATTINTTSIAQAIADFRAATTDLRDEFADMARQFEAWTRAGSGGSQGGNSAGGGSSGSGAGGQGGGGSKRPSRSQRRQQLRGQLADAVRLEAEYGFDQGGGADGHAWTSGQGDGGSGRNAGRSGSGHGGGHGAGVGSYIRSHPSLARLFTPLALAYEADAIAKSAVEIGDAGYIPTGNAASWGTRKGLEQYQASQRMIGRVFPVVGEMANTAVDLGGSLTSWATGNGFVSYSTRKQYQAQQEDLAAGNYYDVKRADGETQAAKTYDPVRRAELQADQRRRDLAQKLEDTKYRDRADTSRLNAEGQKLKDAEEARNKAVGDREQREAVAEVNRRDKDAGTDQATHNRRAFSADLRAHRQYDRDAELADMRGEINDRMAKREHEVGAIQDPAEKQRQERVLQGEQAEARAEKLVKEIEAKHRWALEDQQIVASTAAANLEATGNYYDAVETQAKAAAKARIDAEQDVAKKTLLINEAAAQESARKYKLLEQARHANQSAGTTELRTGGRGLDAATKQIDDDAYEKALANGLIDTTTGRWIDRAKLDPEKQALKDALYRDSEAKKAEQAKQFRYGTQDYNREAQAEEDRFNGDAYGGRRTEREARRKRELDEVQDPGQAGDDRRAAINRKYDAEQKQDDRDHTDSIRSHNLGRYQAELRGQGRRQLADEKGAEVEAAEAIRSVIKDKDLLPAVLAEQKAKLQERLIGSQQSETFGSVAEYANRNFQAAANNDQGAQRALIAAIEQLGKVLDQPTAALQDAADQLVQKFNTIPG